MVDLVRDVGDEVAPHRLVALAVGDVLRQHQLHALAVRAQQHRQRAVAARVREVHRLGEALLLQVGDEGRRAHQVGHALAPVALRVEPEVIGRDAVAPDDLFAGVEDQHAVGRSLDGGEELLEAQPFLLQPLLAQPDRALDAVAELAPEAGVARRLLLLAAAQPLDEPVAARRVEHGRQRHADGAAGEHAPDDGVLDVRDHEAGEATRQHGQHTRCQARQQPVHAEGATTCWVSR